ncbi:hypothetical protein ONE63_004737 [Megalurothrips usitatus]|uniref:Uncharacterized protein n=1 Tax=Megalurothrips usitatus TaxID=439358 RepID=A0AAV7X0M1_9NEOP|nr:hypothetical protein ONE63_004737 [Megalurothrips usitatus]
MANWSSPWSSTTACLGGLFFLALALSLAKLALVVWGSPAAGTAPPHAPAAAPEGAADGDNNDTLADGDGGDVPDMDAVLVRADDRPGSFEGGTAETEADRWLEENDLGHHRDLLQRLGESPLLRLPAEAGTELTCTRHTHNAPRNFSQAFVSARAMVLPNP